MKHSLFLLLFLYLQISLFAQDTIRTLHLLDALRIAKEQNFALRSSRFNVAIQNKEIEKAGIRPNPVFNMQALALLDHSYYPNEPLYTSAQNRQDWFQLTKKMQLYGVRQEKIELEEKQLAQSISIHNTNLRDVLYDVSNKWLDAWAAQVTKTMAAESILSLDSLIQHKVAEGIETKDNNEYLRLLIIDDQYDITDINAQLDLRNELNDLQFLMNAPYILSVDHNDNFNLADIPNNLDSLIQIALRMRSDIAIYKSQVAISQVNLTLQKSYSMPAPEVGFIANPQNTIPYAGIFFTQPLPVFDRNQGEKHIAAISLQKAKLEEEAILAQVRNQVQKAFDAYNIQQLKIEQVEHALGLARLLLANVRKSYIQNERGYVDLWEVERTWYDTKKMYYQADYEYKKSIIELLHVTGLLEQL